MPDNTWPHYPRMMFKISGEWKSPFEIAVCTHCEKSLLIRSKAWFHCSPEQLNNLIAAMQHALEHLETEIPEKAASEAEGA